MTSLHKVTCTDWKFEVYPEIVARVSISSRARNRLNVVLRCCLLAWVDRVWRLLVFLWVCVVFRSVLVSIYTGKAPKVGMWISSVSRLKIKFCLFTLWKNDNIAFFSCLLLLSTKRETPCRLGFLRLLRQWLMTDTLFSVTGAEKDIRESAVTSSCQRQTPSCLTQVSFQILYTNPLSHLRNKSKRGEMKGSPS